MTSSKWDPMAPPFWEIRAGGGPITNIIESRKRLRAQWVPYVTKGVEQTPWPSPAPGCKHKGPIPVRDGTRRRSQDA